jgi:hypothetical protein
MEYKTKFIAGKYKYPVTIVENGNRLWFVFDYNKLLIEQVRLMEGARYHGFEDPPIRQWSVTNSLRNWFQISRLEGKNPYAHYDKPLLDFTPRRECVYKHQIEIIRNIITRQFFIVAGDPAVGKTLSVIEAMEWLAANIGIKSWFYAAPKSALISVREEFEKWKSIIQPQFFTHEKLKSIIENWPAGSSPPQGLILDESQRFKNPTAQRSQAALHLAHSIIKEYGMNGAVIELTGTPAPKSPLDWYCQSEIVRPGWFIEGSYEKFRKRLAYMDEGKSDSGQQFLMLKSWRDDENKCLVCGKLKDDNDHDEINQLESWYHPYQKSINEVAKVYDRMKGLVGIWRKKECLDLPDKIYRQIECKPTQSIINAAKLISAHGYSAIQTNILLRELSDGFQYKDKEVGVETCPLCEGKCTEEDFAYIGPEDKYEELMLSGQEIPKEYYKSFIKSCSNCNGTGKVTRYDKEAIQVPCPKEDALIDLIDQYSDVGRLVTYAGFKGSVDRCVQITLKQQWDVIRIDGRGWWSNLSGNAQELYRKYKRNRDEFPRINIVGQPGAGGVGLNFQESEAIIYYSNDFNGESRMQSIERTHRPGNRGTTIYDLIHLPTDRLVLDNLEKKRKLQDMTLSEIKAVLELS